MYLLNIEIFSYEYITKCYAENLVKISELTVLTVKRLLKINNGSLVLISFFVRICSATALTNKPKSRVQKYV